MAYGLGAVLLPRDRAKHHAGLEAGSWCVAGGKVVGSHRLLKGDLKRVLDRYIEKDREK